MSERIPSPLVGRVLEMVTRQLGNVEVASRLNTTPVLVDMWMRGEAHMPEREFRQVVDILIELEPGWEDWDK